MPEGPEILKSADLIASKIQGKRVEVYFGLPRLKNVEKALSGCLITRVTSRGKALLTFFDNNMVMLTHNQLYGIWFCLPLNEMPNTSRQLRVRIASEEHHALLYSASTIDVMRTEDLEQHPFISKLGPDVLDDEVTVASIRERLMSYRWKGKRLGHLLLEQAFLAGLGNYLRSEILFFARLNYHLKVGELTTEQLSNLSDAIKHVTFRSYKNSFITLPPTLLAQQQEKYSDYEAYRFAVFDREGEGCVYCDAPIKRDDVAGRRLYYCPQCQAADLNT
jgi:endonuclease-8